MISVRCTHCSTFTECGFDIKKYSDYAIWCNRCVREHGSILKVIGIDHIPWPEQNGVWVRPDNVVKVKQIPIYDNIVL